MVLFETRFEIFFGRLLKDIAIAEKSLIFGGANGIFRPTKKKQMHWNQKLRTNKKL